MMIFWDGSYDNDNDDKHLHVHGNEWKLLGQPILQQGFGFSRVEHRVVVLIDVYAFLFGINIFHFSTETIHILQIFRMWNNITDTDYKKIIIMFIMFCCQAHQSNQHLRKRYVLLLLHTICLCCAVVVRQRCVIKLEFTAGYLCAFNVNDHICSYLFCWYCYLIWAAQQITKMKMVWKNTQK